MGEINDIFRQKEKPVEGAMLPEKPEDVAKKLGLI